MQPRLKSSKKWTPIPQDVVLQIQELFKENFQKELQNSRIIAEGRIYQEEILLRVGYIENGRLAQYNFEVSMPYKLTQEDSALTCLSICVDAAGSLMSEHFDDPDALELPYTWTESDFEGKKIWVQHSTENSELAKKASQLLDNEDDKLVYEEEDLEDLADSEDEDPDDDSSGGPKGPLH